MPGVQEAQGGRGEKRHNSIRCWCFLLEQSNQNGDYIPLGQALLSVPNRSCWLGGLAVVAGNSMGTELRSGWAFEALKLGTRYHGVVTLLSLLWVGGGVAILT